MIINISPKRVFWFLILLVLIEPEYLRTVGGLKQIYVYARILVFCFLVFYVSQVKRKVSEFNICLLLLYTILFFVTLFTSGNIVRVISMICSVVSISLYVEIMVHKKSYELINNFIIILGIFIFINFITLMLYPDGMYVPTSWEDLEGDFFATQNWFLGFKNHHLRFFFPYLYFLFLKYTTNNYDSEKRMRVLVIVSLVIVGISAVLGKSATVIGGFGIFIISFLVQKIFQRDVLTMKEVILSSMAIFAVLMLFGSNKGIVNLVELIFAKSETFGDRLGVWHNVIQNFINHPHKLFIGFGRQSNSTVICLLGYNNTHNSFLEIIFTGGVCSFLLFLRLLFVIDKKNAFFKSTSVYRINCCLLLTVLVMMQFETMYYENTILVMFTAMYFINKFYTENLLLYLGEK